MVALTKNTPRESRAGDEFTDPVKAAMKIYAGALTVLDASGDAMPGDTIANGAAVARGVAQEHVDNSGGGDGDASVRVRRGVYRFANSAAADAITRAEIGDVCYVVDDSTVAKTSDTNARIEAGIIRDVDAGGVWVEI